MNLKKVHNKEEIDVMDYQEKCSFFTGIFMLDGDIFKQSLSKDHCITSEIK